MRLVEFEDCEEGFLRHLYGTDLLHALLARLLFLEEFAFTAHVTTVALGGHIFAHLLHGLAGDDFSADCGLDGDIILLTWNQFFELLAHAATQSHGIVNMGQRAQGIHGLAVEQDVQLDELRLAVAVDIVVERGISLADALEFVVEVDDDLAQRDVKRQFHAVTRDILLLGQFAAL